MDNLTRIDDGPVATVYTGLHAGVPVALKVFPKRLDKRTMSAFGKEQAKLATVRGVTSILMVDGVDEVAPGRPALRMELCTQSLTALVERVGQLAAGDVVVLGRAVALALAAAHGAGVVHGGVAPNNVLFRTNAEPVLADFGVTLRQAFTRDPLYAIEFLPPETLRTGTLNESTDLYGLGAVLHFALTGRSPHPGRLGEQPGERVLRILGEPVPAITRTDVPTGLSTLVARLLAAAPDRRPPTAADVAAQLTTMLPAPLRHPTPPEQWDDFDASAPPPPPFSPSPLPPPPPHPTTPAPPHPAIPTAAAHPPLPAPHDDWDDFAVPRAVPAPWHGRPTPAPPMPHPSAPPRTPAPTRTGTAPAPRLPAALTQAAVPPPPAAPAPAAAVPSEPPRSRLSAAAPPPQDPARAAFTQVSDQGPGEMVPDASPAEPPVPGGLPANPVRPGFPTGAPRSPGGAQPPAVVPPLRDAPPAVVAGSPEPGPSVPGAPRPQTGSAGHVPAAPPAEPPEPSEPSAGVAGAEVRVSAPGAASAAASLAGPGAGAARAAADDAFRAPAEPAFLPLAAAPVPAVDVLAGMPTEALPQPGTVRLQRPVVPDQDDFDFVGPPPARRRSEVRVLAGPLAPPGQQPRKLIRYDLLAGAALLLALLALVPLLLLRGDPEEMSSAPRLPQAPERSAPDVDVELDPPVELGGRVKLTWTAPRDLDFAVVVAAEGRATRTLLAQRNHSLTVEVEPDLRYCFQVQASDGDDVYTSDPVPFRGATCRE